MAFYCRQQRNVNDCFTVEICNPFVPLIADSDQYVPVVHHHSSEISVVTV